MIVVVVRSAPLETTMPPPSMSEISYLPQIENPPEIMSYEYMPTDTGYSYRYEIGNVKNSIDKSTNKLLKCSMLAV